jgi:ATP-dependent Clp protease adapter protein ClpS
MNENSNVQDQINEMTTINLGNPYKALLFNDSVHAQDEVTCQIIKAIHCDAVRAVEIMMTAHRTGSAVVFAGTLERCEHVASVLEEIKLLTKVEPA